MRLIYHSYQVMSYRFKLVLLLAILPAVLTAQEYKSHRILQDRLSIQLSEGVLNIIPLTEKSVRIQWEKELKEERQFVLVNQMPVPAFKVSASGEAIQLNTKMISLTFNKQTGAIEYRDNKGNLFLQEKAGSRKLIADTIGGEKCYLAEQGFDSPEGEYLFGTGQFQDGHFNLRNISRKLIQVNSQIAIPFLYSSRGFGLLWHQYGLTELNPADNFVHLSQQVTATSEVSQVEVTTTSGTQRISRQQTLYGGNFTVEQEGDYTMMLDLGNMESRHLLVIDDVPYIDQTNLWLPPSASKIVHLKAGEHKVQVVCKSTNFPRLTWKRVENETVLRSVNAKSLDYVIFYGENADDVIHTYRQLSGQAPMLPLWAYGFWQCRERYTSGDHLVKTVEEFRRRELPMDVIVQDWQYWGKHGWGVPQFDTTHYPEPEKFIKKLHDLHARFSISVWENLDKKSEVAKEYLDKDLYLNNSPWIDIYNPETQKTHWNVLNKNLFKLGVDSWWMDATEPENDALVGKDTYFGRGDFYRLTYPLFVSKAVYEGQRATDPSKRVAILTRSAFLGQQRYGTINWSGDIGWNWDAFKRQIVSGLNYSMTGMPYWTTDIGGFFRPGAGQYTDTLYHDILTRWFQFGTFNTIFRIHGYQTETEPWKYGDTVMGHMRSMLNLRYRLLPYIYSEAWRVSKYGSTMMRPLVMDFGNDTMAISQSYQYMFGKSMLVAPVTAPGVKEWNVYLPKSAGWYDFWTGKRYAGGQTVLAAAPLEQIPLFVKAGSIIPMGRVLQYTSEKPMDTVELRIYTGANGKFMLYMDEGDNYNYENGLYGLIPMTWNDLTHTLTIGNREGKWTGPLKKMVFHIHWVNESNKGATGSPTRVKTVNYTGKQLVVRK